MRKDYSWQNADENQGRGPALLTCGGLAGGAGNSLQPLEPEGRVRPPWAQTVPSGLRVTNVFLRGWKGDK